MSQFSEAFLRSHSSPSVFSRGQQLVFQAKVSQLRRADKQVQAKVEGSSGHYDTSIRLGEEPIGHCTCPYSGPGWCKHLVALGLTILSQGSEDPILLRFEALVNAFESGQDDIQASIVAFQQQTETQRPAVPTIKAIIAHLFGRWDRARQHGEDFDLEQWKELITNLAGDPVSRHFLNIRLMGFGLDWSSP